MIERIIILSLTTIGICCTFWDGMVFEKAGEWVKKYIGEFAAKPLFACYVCATFWYSVIICLVVGWQWWLCVPAMGFSAVVSQLSKDD